MNIKQFWKTGCWMTCLMGGVIGAGSFQTLTVKASAVTPVIASEVRMVEQSEWKAKWSKHQLTFQQALSVVSTRERSQFLTYRLVNQKGDVLQEQPASLQRLTDEAVQATVTFDLSSFTEETYLYLELAYKGQIQKVKHQSEVPTVFAAGRVFQLATKGEDLMLVNQTRSHYTYQDHAYFGEQLHLTLKEASTVKTYQLRQVGRATEGGTIGRSIDQGIDLRFIEEGLYYVYLDQKPVHVSQSLTTDSSIWYTVTRNGSAKQVELTLEAGMLALKVQTLDQLPEEVYDVVIDPGHGGSDPGAVANGTTEAKEVLKVSAYIAERLADHGLKVKMTRTDMTEPSGNQACQYEVCPYLENGRIEQIYATRAKYAISNHLNASANQQSKGSEVYSSVKTSDQWSSQIIAAFESIERVVNDVTISSSRVSTASYKRAIDKTQTDYYYMMRESGGVSTKATSLQEYNAAYPQTPGYGAEALLIEYAYINHATDYQYWIKNWEILGELVVKATVQYLGIPYVSPAVIQP